MATITIASTVIPNVNYVGTVFTWRIFSDKSWVALDGTIVPAQGDANTFFKEYTVSVAGTNATVPQITLLSQTDAPNEKNALYSIYWCVDGVLKDMVLANTLGAFQVPDTPASTTWSALELYNFGVQRRYYKDDGTYSALVIDQKIAAVTGTTNLATSTHAALPTASTAGRQRLLTDEDESIWVDSGSQWFSLTHGIYDFKRFGGVGDNGVTDNTTILSSILTAIGSNQATITFPYSADPYALSTISIPSNVTLDFTAGGSITIFSSQTVTIAGPIIAPPRQIFFNSSGTVSFSGNLKLPVIYPQWWGAKGDNSTDNINAYTLTKAAWVTTYSSNAATEIHFPAGFYRQSAAFNWFREGITLRALGRVYLVSTAASGNVVEFDANPVDPPSNANGYRNRMLGDFNISSTTGTVDIGLYTRNVHQSQFEAKIGNVVTGLKTEGAVSNTYRIKVTTAGENQPIVFPTNGAILAGSALISGTVDCDFPELTLEYCLGTGLVLTSANHNNFTGTSESNGGWGVTIASGSTNNNFIGFFCEFNDLGEIQVTGSTNVFLNAHARGGGHIGGPLTIATTPNSVSPTHITTAITVDNPTGRHWLVTGQVIVLDNYSGTLGTALNGLQTVTVISTTEFTVPVDTSAASAFAAGPDLFVPAIVIKALAKQNAWLNGPFYSAIVEATADSNTFQNFNAGYKIFDSGSNTAVWGLQTNLSASILPPQFTTLTVTNLFTQGEGGALVFSGNTITPTHSIHQLGAGLIKTITVPSPVGFPTTTGITIAIVPTAAFTYDATGNVLGTGTATIGRTMFFTYSMSTAKWSASY